MGRKCSKFNFGIKIYQS